MNQIQQECNTRGITLQSYGMPHNPTDPDRYDGRDDLICCSIEYPNTNYFFKVRKHDHLFKVGVQTSG